MQTERILGFVLLAIGFSIIIFSLYSSFQIFTGEKDPPGLFAAPDQQPTSEKLGGLEAQIENFVDQRLRDLLGADTIPRMLNYIMWSVFSGLLFLGGGQIARIGIKLLKVKRAEE